MPASTEDAHYNILPVVVLWSINTCTKAVVNPRPDRVAEVKTRVGDFTWNTAVLSNPYQSFILFYQLTFFKDLN
jgi:hypothetical protein